MQFEQLWKGNGDILNLCEKENKILKDIEGQCHLVKNAY